MIDKNNQSTDTVFVDVELPSAYSDYVDLYVTNEVDVDMSQQTTGTDGSLNYTGTYRVEEGQGFNINFSNLKAYSTVKASQPSTIDQPIDVVYAKTGDRFNMDAALDKGTMKKLKNAQIAYLQLNPSVPSSG